MQPNNHEHNNIIYYANYNVTIIYSGIKIKIYFVDNSLNYIKGHNFKIINYSGDNNISSLNFEHYNDKNIKEDLVVEITYLSNLQILNIVPNLRFLFFNNAYNELIHTGALPESLQEISFYGDYNQVINKNVLPQGLQKLIFKGKYYAPINPCVLPSTLYKLLLGGEYNQLITHNVLPASLRKLILSGEYN